MDITIPAVGESITEGVLSRWLVENGGFATEGEPLYELETDKISTEIVADASGIVTHGAAEDDTVEVGAVIGSIDTSASASDAAPAAAPTTEVAPTAPLHLQPQQLKSLRLRLHP